MVIGDAFLVLLSYFFAYTQRFGSAAGFSAKFPLILLILMIMSYLTAFYFFDLYAVRKSYFKTSFFFPLILGVLSATVLVSIIKYGLFLHPIGRGIFLMANLLILVFAFAWREICHQLFNTTTLGPTSHHRR